MEMRYTYMGGIEFALRLADAMSASHPGDCEASVRALLSKPYVYAQLNQLSPKDIADAIRETGAWDEAELADEDMSRVRFVWIAACDIREDEAHRE